MSIFAGACKALLTAVLLTSGLAAQGAVSLSGTRLIFDGQYREVTLEVRNRGKSEALVQAWLSDAADDADTPGELRKALPFVVTPPLSRLPVGGRRQAGLARAVSGHRHAAEIRVAAASLRA